jgi:hypothetical protein
MLLPLKKLRDDTYRVGDGGDGAAERGGEEDWVEEGAVGADEQHAGLARLAAGRRRRVAPDGDNDAEGAESVVHHVHRQERAGGDAEAREQKPDRDPEHGEQRERGRRLLHEPPVVEHNRPRQVLARHGLEPRRRGHHVPLLAQLHERVLRPPVAEPDLRRDAAARLPSSPRRGRRARARGPLRGRAT